MSNYLRDARLESLIVNEQRLTALNGLIDEIVQHVNAGLEANNSQRLRFAYIVRGDNKGAVLYDFQDALRCFREAQDVQRVVIVINTVENANSAFPGPLRIPYDGHGKCIFIWLSQDELSHPQGLEFQPNIVPQQSSLAVTDDDRAWTEATFVRIKEELDKYQSVVHKAIRTSIVPAIIRLILGLFSFALALVGAFKFSTLFSSPEASTFLFVVLAFLLHVTITPLMYPPLMRLINRSFPNIAFKVSNSHWLVQAFVAIVMGTVVVAIGGFLYSSIMTALHPYLSSVGQTLVK